MHMPLPKFRCLILVPEIFDVKVLRLVFEQSGSAVRVVVNTLAHGFVTKLHPCNVRPQGRRVKKKEKIQTM